MKQKEKMVGTHIRLSMGRKIFLVADYLFLACSALLCLLPLINVLAVSLSSSNAAAAGYVKLWPVEFTWSSYQYALTKPQFTQAFLISAKRVALGYAVTMVVIILTAYPLSKEKDAFRARGKYAWIFIFTMMFSGGLIPTYMTIRYLGMLDTIWALVLPGAVPIFNVVLMMNFFRSIPEALEESARIDGANDLTIFFRIIVPVSMPVIATIMLFNGVGHWNDWYTTAFYTRDKSLRTASFILKELISKANLTSITGSDAATAARAAEAAAQNYTAESLRMATMIVVVIPIVCVCPFLQKYFVKGVMIGSIKG